MMTPLLCHLLRCKTEMIFLKSYLKIVTSKACLMIQIFTCLLSFFYLDDEFFEAMTIATPCINGQPQVDAKVLDGAAIVQMLNPKPARTFEKRMLHPSCSKRTCICHETRHCMGCLPWRQSQSCYPPKERIWVTEKVIPSATLPDNWKGFLRGDDNKTVLFAFLAKKVGGPKVEGKQLVTTLLSGILASPPLSDVSGNSLQPCSHEEADTRLFLHVQDCSRSGSRVMIRSTDTDVIVLAVANFRRLPVQEIWIAFGVRKHFRYLPAHKIALQLGPQSSEALPMFHVFSGCDSVSFFAGKGKNKCLETWKSFPEATATFLLLAKGPERI